jgi:hypothetical protein
MSWNTLLGIISCIALILPVTLLAYYKLAGYRTFPVLLMYYIIVLAVNLTAPGMLNVNVNLHSFLDLSSQVIEAPLLIIFLTYFSYSHRVTRLIRYSVVMLAGYEVIIVTLKGFDVSILPFTVVPGLLITFGISISLFVRQAKIAITNHKTTGKALLLASCLFASGCYFILYTLLYVVGIKNTGDAYLVYFMVTTFSSLLISFGIAIEKKRVRKLNEIKITRRELSSLYADEKPAIKLTPAVSEIPQEQWN